MNTLAVGLVGYWSFDEGGGAVAVDRSGNGNDGALTAALDPATSWVTGRRGKALAFPNADHAGVEVPPSASLDRIRTAYTLGAWVRRAPNAQTYNTVISRGVDQTYFEHYSLSIWERRPSLHASHAGKDDVHVAAAVTVTDGAWQYVAATFDGEVIRVYLDAKLGHEQAYPGPVTFDGAPLLIGNNRNHWTNDFGQSGIANEFMVGALDEVVIYDRALSVAEIAALASGSGPL